MHYKSSYLCNWKQSQRYIIMENKDEIKIAIIGDYDENKPSIFIATLFVPQVKANHTLIKAFVQTVANNTHLWK